LFVVQITIYAGAVMVLFLFVVMILGRRDVTLAEPLAAQRFLGVTAAATLGGLLVWATSSPNAFPAAPAASVPPDFGSPAELGRLLFSAYVLPFELVSLLLLAAVLGAVLLGQFRESGADADEPDAAGLSASAGGDTGREAVLMLSAVLFSLGVAGVVLRRNLILVLMSIELMLNAVNLSLVALARAFATADAQVFVFFSLTVAAAEVAVGLALVITVYRSLGDADVDDASVLHG
jgi:NADH-quinone oxidoreductase subunit K